MKGYFRSFIITAFALWVVLKFVPGVILDGDWQTFILVSAALFVSTFFVKPVVKLIFLPFNIVTFNFISVAVTAGLLLLLSFIVPQLKINSFVFAGINHNGIVVPKIELNQFLTLLVAALIITIISAVLNWISD